MECSCCGQERETVALRSHSDIRICRVCNGWLAGQLGITSTPTLPVLNMDEAVAFYEQAGFSVRRYIDESGSPGDFAFVEYDDQSVFDLDVVDIDPARNGSGCYLVVAEADEWHHRVSAAGLAVSSIADQPWGMREFTLTDPYGNNIRIGRSSDGA